MKIKMNKIVWTRRRADEWVSREDDPEISCALLEPPDRAEFPNW